MDWRMDDWSLSSRVSPFRYLRIRAYLQLPAAFRSLSRLSSALSAKASTLRSFLLNPRYHSVDNFFFIKELFGFRCLEKDISLIIICMKFSRYNAIVFEENNRDAKLDALTNFAMVHDWQSQSWD